jgi:hypothetical protein
MVDFEVNACDVADEIIQVGIHMPTTMEYIGPDCWSLARRMSIKQCNWGSDRATLRANQSQGSESLFGFGSFTDERLERTSFTQ